MFNGGSLSGTFLKWIFKKIDLKLWTFLINVSNVYKNLKFVIFSILTDS